MAIKTNRVSIQKTGAIQAEIKARDFTIIVDEPVENGGTDAGMMPVELILGALGSCQLITALIFAKSFSINIEDMRVEVEADRDSDGIVKTKDGLRPGFTSIRCHFFVKSDSSELRIKQLIEMVEKKCPVGESIMNGVPFAHPEITLL